jgi:transcriptional regulator with XRE-family HTH domain
MGARLVPAAERLRLRVRRLLQVSRWTQKDLAAALSLNQSDISRRLTGKQPFKVEELDTIAQMFHIGVSELFFDEYGRFDRRKGSRRSGSDRRKVNLYALREDPQPWHSPERLRIPPPPPGDAQE